MMPLCKRDRRIPGKREDTCLVEHISSTDKEIGCFGIDNRRKAFPKEKQVYIGVEEAHSHDEQENDDEEQDNEPEQEDEQVDFDPDERDFDDVNGSGGSDF
jgi:hypothetical protein